MPKQTALDTINRLIAEENSSGVTRQRTGDAVRTIDQLLAEEEEREQQRRQQTAYQKALNDYTSFAPMDIAKASQEALDSAKSRDNDWWQARRNEASADATKQIAKTSQEILNEKKEPEPVNLILPAPSVNRTLNPALEAEYQRHANAQGTNVAPGAWAQNQMKQANDRQAQAQRNISRAPSGWRDVGLTVGGTAANFLSGSGSIVADIARLMEIPDDILYAITKNERFNLDRAPGLRDSEALRASDQFAELAQNASDQVGKFGQQLISTGRAAGNMMAYSALLGNAFGQVANPGRMASLSNAASDGITQIASKSSLITSAAGRAGAKIALDVLTNPGNVGISLGSAINSYSDAYANGATIGQALANGVGKGLAEYFSNKMFSGTPFEDAKDAQGYVSRLVEHIAKDTKWEELLKAFNTSTGGKAVNWVIDKIGEGLEEVITGLADPVVDKLTYKWDTDMATFDELTDEFFGGVLLSLLMSGGEALMNQVVTGGKADERRIADAFVSMGVKRNVANKFAKKVAEATTAVTETEGWLNGSYNGTAAELMRNQDYAEKSAGKAEIAAQAQDSNSESLRRYSSIFNRMDEASKVLSGTSPSEVSETAWVNELEARNYFYIWETQGAKAADAYYEQTVLPGVLNKKARAQEQFDQIQRQEAEKAAQQEAARTALQDIATEEAQPSRDRRSELEAQIESVGQQAANIYEEDGRYFDRNTGEEVAQDTLRDLSNQYRQLRQEYDNLETEVNNGQVEQQRAETPVQAAESGTPLPGGGQGRVALRSLGESAQKQAGQGGFVRQGQRAYDRRNRKGSARKVKAAELGLTGAKEGAETLVFDRDQWDDDMRETADLVKRATGLDTVYVLGNIDLDDGGSIRGAFTGNSIIVQCDHPEYTVAQLAAHESYHALAAANPGLDEQVKAYIRSVAGGEAKLREIAGRYIEKLGDVFGLSDDMTEAEYQAAKAAIEQEVLADAFAGMNVWGAGATQLSPEVRSAVNTNRQNAAATERTTGPPVPGRLTLPTNEGRTESEPKTGAESVEKYSLNTQTIDYAIKYVTRDEELKGQLSLVKNDIVELADIQNVITKALGKKTSRNIHDLNDYLNENRKVWKRLWDIQQELIDNGIQCDFVTKPGTKNEIDGKKVPGGLKGLPIEYVASDTGKRFKFTAFWRNIPQMLLDSMTHDSRERIRTAIMHGVEDAYARKTGETDLLPYFKDQFPKKGEMNKVIGERKLKNIRNQTQKRVQPPIRDAEKTVGALNLNSACPMFTIGNNGCYLDACYLTQMANGATGTNLFRSAWYTGELLQIAQSDIELMNELGGLRVNGVGDTTLDNKSQIKDALRHAGMRGLKVKIITKQRATLEVLKEMHDAGEDVSHITVQPSMDNLWIPAKLDDAYGAGVRGNTQLAQTVKAGRNEAAAVAYDEMFGRATKVMDGVLYRKYGFTAEQIREMQEDFPFVNITPRYVVCTAAEIAEIALNRDGQYVNGGKTIQTLMHGKVPSGCVSDYPGELINFGGARHVVERKDGKWHFFGEYISKGKDGKGKVGKIIDGPKTPYGKVQSYIEKNYTKAEQDKIWLTLKNQMCCQANDFKDACAGCQSLCARGCGAFSAEDFDYRKYSQKEKARAMETGAGEMDTGSGLTLPTAEKYSRDVTNEAPERRYNIPDGYAAFVRNTAARFADRIVNGEKTIETRKDRTLDAYLGKWMPIIKTESGEVIGEAFIDSVKEYDNPDDFYADSDKHFVTRGDKQFGWDGTGKRYGYDITAVRKYDTPIPKGDKRYGRIAAEFNNATAEQSVRANKARKAGATQAQVAANEKYSREINALTYFSGGGLVDYAMRDVIGSGMAVEFDKGAAAVYALNNGKVYVGDVRNFSKTELAKMDGVEYFHASPVCKNYSRMNIRRSQLSDGNTDITTAQATADAIRGLDSLKVFTLEQVPEYDGSDALKIITDALDEMGFVWDKTVANAHDYGGATSRERLMLRAVKDGKLPAKPAKVKGYTWFEATADLITGLEAKDRLSPFMQERINRTPELVAALKNQTEPILLLGGTPGGKAWWSPASDPCPSITTDMQDARILMPDGTIRKPNPRFFARIMGLPDSYKFSQWRNKDNATQGYKVIGNGVPVQLTQKFFGNLLNDALNTGVKYSREEDMDSELEDKLSQFAKAVDAPQSFSAPDMLASMYRMYRNGLDNERILGPKADTKKARELAEEIDALTGKVAERRESIKNESVGDWAIRMFEEQYLKPGEDLLKGIQDWVKKELDRENDYWKGEWEPTALQHYNEAYERTDFTDINSVKKFFEDAEAAFKENGERGIPVYGYYDEEHGNSVRFSREERPEVVKRLDQQMKDGNYVIVYHSMYQDKNGKLYSPMAGKKKVGNEWVMTDPYALNVWYKSDVPENIADLIENGTVKLKDSGGWSFLLKKPETGGTDVPAALNPWNHASTDALNDQFNAAFARETDEGELVTVECVIPLSEVDPSVAVDPETGKVKTKPYEELGMVTDRDVVAKPDSQNKKLKAPTNIPAGTTIKPKDSVGLKMWKAGPVHGQISGKRPVYLSRWIRNTRVLSTEETAKMIAKTLKDENFSGTIPGNVVGLKLRKALENEGVKFGSPTNKGYYAYMSERGYTKQQADGERLPAQEQKFSREEDEAYLSAVNSGDMETAQRMVDEAAKKAGYRVEKYHGTKANFNTFDPDYARYGGSGYGYYFGDKEIAEEFGADDYGEDGNVLRVLINDSNIGTQKSHNIAVDGFESAFKELGLSPENTYQYLGSDTAAEYVKAHHDYRLATDLQYWASIPEKYAENPSAKEIPPRKILAILQDDLGLDGIRKDSFGRELVLWDNHLMKLADPVTYDDDGNIIPLSQRFNPKSNDIRYSTEEEEYTPQSAAEYDQLKKAGKIKVAKEKVKKPVAKSKATIAKKDLRNALITSFSIPDGFKADIGKMIDGIADRIIRDGRVSYQDQEELFSKLYSTGEMTVPADETFASVRDELVGSKIYVPEAVKHEFGDDWADIRKEAFGHGIYFTNNPDDMAVDVWNSDVLAFNFPGVFNENAHPHEVIERLLSVARAGKAEKMSLPEYAAKMVGAEFATEDDMMTNLERQLDWALRTFADKAGLEIYLKDRTGVKLAEEREKFGRELDRRTAAEIARRAKEREKLKEAAQKAREQKAMRELQQKTLKQLQWLNKNRYKFSGDMKAEVDKLLEDIDTYAISAANELHLDKKRNMTWRDIRDLYLEAKESDPNFLPSKELERIVARLDYKKIGDLDVGALQDLYKAAVGLRTELYNRNNLIADELHQTFQEVYDAAKEEINEAPGGFSTGAKGAWDRFWSDAQLTPMNRLQRMAGWNPDSRWYGMAKMLEQGERAQRRFKTESARQLAPVLEQYKDWAKTADGQGKDAVWYKYEVPESWEYRMGDKPVFSDKTVTVWMTPAQKVHMYLESKNYDNLRHMEGGRTFANKELYSKGERTEAFAQGTTVRLLPETVKAMVSDLTPEEQALADALEKYYNGFSKDEINRVSNLLYGYDKAMEASYAPIYTNNNYTKSEPGNFDVTAEGVGNLKSRVVSSNPSLNIGAFDAFEKSVDKTSKFVGLAIPVQNMNTLMNWREKGNSMKDIIDHKWGEKETKWIEDLLTELQSGNDYKRGSVEKLTNAVLSKYISAVFGANPSIVAKQFASYPLAATYLGWENMPKFVPTAAQVDTDLMAKYTGELDYRLLGYATPETATLKDNPSKLQQKGPLNFLLGGGAITWMDGFTVRTLWTWAENKVKREQPDLERGTQGQIDAGESEYYKAVAKEFEEAVSRSQPMYDVMHRSNIMRESNPVTRALTLFKTVPQQELNMLRQAIGEAEYYKRTKADADTLSESRTKVGRAALGVITGNLMIGLITFLNALWKNRAKRYRDEDGELNAESIIGAALKQYVKDSAGLVVGGGEAADLLSAILLGDKWYGLEMPGIEQIGSILEQTVDAGTMVKDIVQGSIDVLSNGGDWGQYMADNSEKYLAAVDKAVSSIGTYATGLPMDNLKAYLLGTVTSVFPQIQTAYEDATKQAVKGGLKGLTGASLEVRAKHILQDRAGKVERDTIEALTALYEAGYDKVIPSAQQTKITVKGEERELNTAQQQIYKNIWKETVGGALDELVSSKAFLDADDKTQAKMIEKLYDVAAEKAKGVLFDDYESTTENKLDAMQSAGASVADYAATTGATADAKRADSYETILASDMSDEAKLAAIGNIIGTDMTTDAGNPTQWARLNTAVKDGMSVDDAMDLMQNELLDDYDRWRSSDAKKAGIGWNIYKSYKADTGAMKADKDANGKSISGTKKAKVLDYINRMNITKAQKDTLYYDAGYTESGLKDTPWHQGGGSGSGSYARLTLPTAKKPWEVADDMELRSMNDYGGNVDLTNRKSIPITQANIDTVKGWGMDAKVGDRMTVASQTFRDGNTAIVVTPILPDGTLMTQRELEDYWDSLRGTDYTSADKRGIILGVFDDGDWNENLAASDEFANRLHELHERKTERRTGLRLPTVEPVQKRSTGRLELPTV